MFLAAILLSSPVPTSAGQGNDAVGPELTTPHAVCTTTQSYFEIVERFGADHPTATATLDALLPRAPFLDIAASATSPTAAQSLEEDYHGRKKGLSISLGLIAGLARDLGVELGKLSIIECRALDHTSIAMRLRDDIIDLPFIVYADWIGTRYLVARVAADGLIHLLRAAYQGRTPGARRLLTSSQQKPMRD